MLEMQSEITDEGPVDDRTTEWAQLEKNRRLRAMCAAHRRGTYKPASATSFAAAMRGCAVRATRSPRPRDRRGLRQRRSRSTRSQPSAGGVDPPGSDDPPGSLADAETEKGKRPCVGLECDGFTSGRAPYCSEACRKRDERARKKRDALASAAWIELHGPIAGAPKESRNGMWSGAGGGEDANLPAPYRRRPLAVYPGEHFTTAEYRRGVINERRHAQATRSLAETRNQLDSWRERKGFVRNAVVIRLPLSSVEDFRRVAA